MTARRKKIHLFLHGLPEYEILFPLARALHRRGKVDLTVYSSAAVLRREPRLRVLYREKVAKALREEFSYPSVQQVPKLEKIVVSMGVGEALANKKLLDAAVKELAQITGLKPIRTKAKKSIANFKVRKGNEIGAMVTLRGYHMYEFLDRLANVALPRVKDFRGINPNAFDGRGNYALGLTEQIIFPEIDYDKIERVSGMNIAICTTARTDQEGRQLLTALGMPFRK